MSNTVKTERLYLEIPPRAFTQDGTTNGVVTVADACLFKVGQEVTLKSDTQNILKVKVNRVSSSTTLEVGPIGENIKCRLDISNYTVADNATILMREQNRPVIDLLEIDRIIYEEEPTMAHRNVLVDCLGNFYTTKNPFPVQLSDGSIEIGTVNAELEVQLSHRDNYPDLGDVADSVQVGDGTEILQINPDGSINVKASTPKRTPDIVNIQVTTANTEFNYTLPTDATKYKIRARDGAAKLQLAFNSGETNTKYWTVSRGSTEEEEGLDVSGGTTLYFQASKTCIVEILIWKS